MQEIPQFKFALREDLKGDDRFLPTRSEPFASGWDVSVAPKNKKDIVIRAGQKVMIPLGFRVFCPKNWWLKLEPRSSTFTKKSLNSLCGVIDEGWEGEMVFACQLIPDINSLGKDLIIKFGERIGQIIPVFRQEMIVEEISNNEYDKLCSKRNGVRGANGFGSSDLR